MGKQTFAAEHSLDAHRLLVVLIVRIEDGDKIPSVREVRPHHFVDNRRLRP
jgi:hypothetical protein